MTRRPLRYAFPAAVLAALALAGCATTAEHAAPPADTRPARCLPEAVGCDDTAEEAPAGIIADDIEIVPALPDGTVAVETAPGSGEAARVFLQQAVVDGDRVTVTFVGGEAPCFAVDSAEVVEDPRQVVVSVFVAVPGPTADCTSQTLTTQAVTVALDAPLGGRALKDGSRAVGA